MSGDIPARNRQQLTARGLAALQPGEWANDTKPHGAGQLQARKLASGDIAFYYRYTAPGRRQVRLPLGTGLSLTEAREEASRLSRRYQAGERDLREALAHDHREREREQKQRIEAERAKEAQARATLGALLHAYVADMRRAGKVSADKVEKSLRLHVEQTWPKLWGTPAAEVTADDLLPVVAQLSEQGKLREADKLRAYLRAAYAAGIRARQSAHALAVLRNLRITVNPARDLTPIDGARQARARVLSVSELRAYWQRINALPDPDGALLRFHLLTGGQRVEQLSRIMLEDLDLDTQVVRLYDGKGRRRTPRRHDVPLLPEAVLTLEAMQGGLSGPYLFSVAQGDEGASYAVLQRRLKAVVEMMEEAGELERGPFTVGDLRRTVETRLAAEGVSLDIRAQLQSHGLGGVQARHYDRHDYLSEKRAALETLYGVLTRGKARTSKSKKQTGTSR